MASAWPGVVGYLLTTLPTLPGWTGVAIYDGPPNTGDDPSDYCTVGYVTDDSAGSFTQGPSSDYMVTEEGVVRLVICSQSGDEVLTGVRSRAFQLFDALDAHIRADQTLGGLLGSSTVYLASDAVLSESNSRGVAQLVVCSVAYHTETPQFL